MTPFEAELKVASWLRGTVTSDMKLQHSDIDVVLDIARPVPGCRECEWCLGHLGTSTCIPHQTTTVSVKLQSRAADTGNVSLETELVSTSTGRRVPGNFLKCKATHIAFVIPEGFGQYVVYLVPHAALLALTKSHPWETASLGSKGQAENRAQGRQFDSAVNLLIPISALLTVTELTFRIQEEA